MKKKKFEFVLLVVGGIVIILIPFIVTGGMTTKSFIDGPFFPIHYLVSSFACIIGILVVLKAIKDFLE